MNLNKYRLRGKTLLYRSGGRTEWEVCKVPFILCGENSIFPVLAVFYRMAKSAVQLDIAGFVFYHRVSVVKFINWLVLLSRHDCHLATLLCMGLSRIQMRPKIYPGNKMERRSQIHRWHLLFHLLKHRLVREKWQEACTRKLWLS